MVRFTREQTTPELTLLRRRVELLEAQVQALAQFTGIDPNHLPSQADTVSAEVRALVEQGKTVQAVKVHREQTGLDLLTAKRDVDAIAHGRI